DRSAAERSPRPPRTWRPWAAPAPPVGSRRRAEAPPPADGGGEKRADALRARLHDRSPASWWNPLDEPGIQQPLDQRGRVALQCLVRDLKLLAEAPQHLK